MDMWNRYRDSLADRQTGSCRRPAPVRRRRFMSGVLLLAAAAGLWACSNEKSGQAQAKGSAGREGVPVTIDTAVSKSVPVQIRAIGTVQAYASVTLKSQLDGEVARIHFSEGQEVKKGDLLFTLDQRPLEATLRQAEANLARDTAQLAADRSRGRPDHGSGEAGRGQPGARHGTARERRVAGPPLQGADRRGGHLEGALRSGAHQCRPPWRQRSRRTRPR